MLEQSKHDHPACGESSNLRRLSICAGMFLASVAFGLSIGSRWSGATFIAALWCQIIGVLLLFSKWGNKESA